jgi:hypothetical protein
MPHFAQSCRWPVTLLAAFTSCALFPAAAPAETEKAQPKNGRSFTPPLSARVPAEITDLPRFGAIDWTVTQLPWVGEGPYEGISGAGMVAIGGQIYVVGGFIPGGDGSGDEASHRTSRWTWRYDPATGEWRQMADAPFRSEYTRAIASGGKLYLAGGGCQFKGAEPPYAPLGDCAVFDPTAGPKGAWTTLASLHVPRTHMAVGEAAGRLVVAGGNQYDFAEQGYSRATIRGTVDVYNLANPDQGWQTRASIPGSPRGWCASAVANGALYLMGGITWNEQNQTVPTPETLRYDVAADAWERRTPPPVPVSGWEGALYVGRYILNVAGVVRPTPGSNEDLIWSDLVLAYDTKEDRWLQVADALPPGAVFNDPGVVVIGDAIYVLGAEGPDGSHYDYFLIGEISEE